MARTIPSSTHCAGPDPRDAARPDEEGHALERPATYLRLCLPEEKDLIGEAVGLRGHAPGNRIGEHNELVATKTRGNPDDAGVGLLAVDRAPPGVSAAP
jgi:hypothetical protein